MKKLVLSAALLLSASIAMMSCNNGAYDANPLTNNSGTPVPSTNTDFNWTGTDPMSAKVDGNAFQASSFTYTTFSGNAFIAGDNNNLTITLNLPENAAANSVVTLGGTTTLNVTVAVDVYSSGLGGSGSVKILENDAAHIKGLFTGTVKNTSGATKTVTDGYFNITK